MWYVFPQIEGPGQSPMARRFAISGREEARAYLDHPILGARLRECARAINALTGRTAEEIFGLIDAVKLRSSMTLFKAVGDSTRRHRVEQRSHAGHRECPRLSTLQRAEGRELVEHQEEVGAAQ